MNVITSCCISRVSGEFHLQGQWMREFFCVLIFFWVRTIPNGIEAPGLTDMFSS